MSDKVRKLINILCCGICGIWFLWFMINVPVANIFVANYGSLIIWPDATILHLRWLLVLLSVALAVVTLCFCARPWSFVGYLPLVSAVMLMSDFLPHSLSAGFVFILPVAVVALLLVHFLNAPMNQSSGSEGREWTMMILIVSSVFYTLVGGYMALAVGEHAGDEAHYINQAKSLYSDHDLDLKNNILKGCSQAEKNKLSSDLKYIHILPNGRDGRWYTHHPHGLPVLMSPFTGTGVLGKYILFGLIGALANVGMYMSSRLLGAGRNASVVTVGILGTSLFWSIYSARALPEMLGAALLCWSFWAILVREKWPWRSVLVGGICCGYLVHAHERFIPLSLLAWGFYGLFGLFSRGEWRSKILRLSVFTLICFAFYGAYAYSQFIMFEGGVKYSVKGTIMTYPLGMWGVIAGMSGIVSVMPFYICILAGFVVWFAGSCTTDRFFGAAVFSILATLLLTSCATTIYAAGACLPGRYLLVSVPLFVAPAAVALHKSNRSARWWFLFVGGISTALLLWELIFMARIGKNFVTPVHALPDMHSGLLGLFYPYSSYSFTVTILKYDCLANILYIVGCFFLTVFLLKERRGEFKRSVVLILAMILLGIGGHAGQSHRKPLRTYSRHQLMDWMNHARLRQSAVFSNFKHSVNLFDISEARYKDFDLADTGLSITTKDLGARMKGRIISQPRIDVNDWSERGYRWTTLTAPYAPASGMKALHIEGVVDGDVDVVLAIKEGSSVLYEARLEPQGGVFNESVLFNCGGYRGDLYILMHLTDGEGYVKINELHWTPYDPGLTAGGGISLPGRVSGGDR